MSTYTVLILSMISSLAASEFYQRNVNSFDGYLHFSCPNDRTLRRIDSYHNDYHWDRRWSFGCRHANATITGCHWSGYVNSWYGYVNVQCNGDGFINGMKSFHRNYGEDRRWAYQCCTLTGHRAINCLDTGYQNNYRGNLAYTVPGSKLIHGASSGHSWDNGDRRFAFRICDYEPIVIQEN